MKYGKVYTKLGIEKLKEALAELQKERIILDSVIASTEKSITLMDNSTAATEKFSTPHDVGRSNVEAAVLVLQREGHPLHINVLAERVSTFRGKEVSRASLEAGIVKHISDADQPKIARFAPSTFGLPSWANSALAPSA